jgi:BRCT domain type II-containing protein
MQHINSRILANLEPSSAEIVEKMTEVTIASDKITISLEFLKRQAQTSHIRKTVMNIQSFRVQMMSHASRASRQITLTTLQNKVPETDLKIICMGKFSDREFKRTVLRNSNY